MTGNKYGAVRVNHAGFSFGSKLEAAVYDHLFLLEKAGEIENIRTQVSVYLTRARIQYVADFCFTDKASGNEVYAEAKGVETQGWRIKRRLWIYYGPGKLWIFKGSYSRVRLHEEVVPVSDGEIDGVRNELG